MKFLVVLFTLTWLHVQDVCTNRKNDFHNVQRVISYTKKKTNI